MLERERMLRKRERMLQRKERILRLEVLLRMLLVMLEESMRALLTLLLSRRFPFLRMQIRPTNTKYSGTVSLRDSLAAALTRFGNIRILCASADRKGEVDARPILCPP